MVGFFAFHNVTHTWLNSFIQFGPEATPTLGGFNPNQKSRERLISSVGAPIILQSVVNHEYERRRWGCTQTGDAATTIHATESMLIPERAALFPKGTLNTASQSRCLHSGLYGVCREEQKVVGYPC